MPIKETRASFLSWESPGPVLKLKLLCGGEGATKLPFPAKESQLTGNPGNQYQP